VANRKLYENHNYDGQLPTCREELSVSQTAETVFAQARTADESNILCAVYKILARPDFLHKMFNVALPRMTEINSIDFCFELISTASKSTAFTLYQVRCISPIIIIRCIPVW
jgi:hypothetical protein